MRKFAAAKTLDKGKKLYARGKPMPPKPDDDDASSRKSWLWQGWMLGRMTDVARIFHIMDVVGIRGTKEGDRLTKGLVKALDRKIGFTPIEW